MDKDLELLHQKLDYLTEQLEAQRQQQEGMNELMHDAVPVVNHMIKLSIDELAEIGTDFQLEDLTFLLKRVLRDTRMLVGLLDQVEAVAELAEEGQVMGKRIFHRWSWIVWSVKGILGWRAQAWVWQTASSMSSRLKTWKQPEIAWSTRSQRMSPKKSRSLRSCAPWATPKSVAGCTAR